MSHTPAPWHVQLHKGNTINGAAVVAVNGLSVVTLPRRADRPYYQKEADACLVAAAPELLAALNALWDWVWEDNRGDGQYPESRVRAALLKVKAV